MSAIGHRDTRTNLFLSGNDKDDGVWHRAMRREHIGPVTGKVLHSALVAACSGRRPGGPYGASTRDSIGEFDRMCKRCEQREIAVAVLSFALAMSGKSVAA